MENYTLETTKNDFKNGRINQHEFGIIKKYIKTREEYYNANDVMEKHFLEKFKDSILNAKVKSDLTHVKEGLRVMPESVGKNLIFRVIIMKEEGLKLHKKICVERSNKSTANFDNKISKKSPSR